MVNHFLDGRCGSGVTPHPARASTATSMVCHVKAILSKEIIFGNKSEFSFTKIVRSGLRRLATLARGVIWLILLTFCSSLAAEPVMDWRTDGALQRQLLAGAGITWVENPLRQGLEHLGKRKKVCIFLDRRIDPGQTATVAVKNVTLDEVFHHIAEHVGASTCQIDSVIYIAPQAVSRKLSTLAAVKRQQVRRLDSLVKRRLFHRTRWHWPQLTTPRDLLEQAAKVADLSLDRLEAIPHDLWPATELPPTNVVDFLTIVTAGFDLSFEFDEGGSVVRLVPAPAEVQLTEEYPVSKATVSQVAKLRQSAPAATIDVQSNRIMVVGSWEDHQQIRRLLSGRTRRDATAHLEKRYDLHVEASGERLLTTVAAQLGLKLHLDDLARERLQSRIRVDVTQATTDQLLDAILLPLQVEFNVLDETLHVEGE